MRNLKASNLADLQTTLVDAKKLFQERNELVHGRLFAGGRLVSNQVNAPVRLVSAEDIVGLAERIYSSKEQLWMHRCRQLLPFLSSLPVQSDD